MNNTDTKLILFLATTFFLLTSYTQAQVIRNIKDAVPPQVPSESIEDNRIYDITEIEPVYRAGSDSLEYDLRRYYHHPEIAEQNGVEGKVVIKFVVEKDGSISGVKCTRCLGYGIDEAAVAAVRQLGPFVPARNSDEVVRSYYHVTIDAIPMVYELREVPKPASDPQADPMYIYEWPEVDATYPRGIDSLIADISRKYVYPDEARESGIEGSVRVSLVVEKDGSISDIKSERSPGYGLDQAVISAVEKLGPFIPGTNEGEAVRSRLRFTVKARIDRVE